MIVMSVDPGQHGALAVISEGKLWAEPLAFVDGEVDIPETTRLIHSWLPENPVCYIEKAFGMKGQGVVSTFNYGTGYGVIRGILGCLGIRTILVPPQRWMKVLHYGIPRDIDAKRRSLMAFEQIFPGFDATAPGGRTPHTGIVDAGLIAEYGRRMMADLK